jgi:DtxR family transcriptional regulator, Mn-dependent transcriptional regulator
MRGDRAKGDAVISHAMEDYLKAIYELSAGSDRVTTSKLAERMACTPASVTNMLQKLSSLRLVEYAPYRGVTLTATGTKIALEVVRHHRLIELYLAEVLGYSWDRVHDEADLLEHVISEEFEDKIDRALGYPTKDPHGAPIPTKDGTIETGTHITLWEAVEGQRVSIEQVDDRSSDVLRYLAGIGILPEVRLVVLRRVPFNGPIHVSVDDREHWLGEELARQILVRVE